jgi:hypothetical protein
MMFNIKMGRKNRNRISKHKNEEVVEVNDDQEEENESDRHRRLYERHLDIIWETRVAMINHCDEACIPLCDYLTIDVLEQFIDYLS